MVDRGSDSPADPRGNPGQRRAHAQLLRSWGQLKLLTLKCPRACEFSTRSEGHTVAMNSGPAHVLEVNGGDDWAVHLIPEGGLSFLPALASNGFRTGGPVEVVLLELPPSFVASVGIPDLPTVVGFENVYVEQIMRALMATAGSGQEGKRAEKLAELILSELANCLLAAPVQVPKALDETPLRRVLEHVAANLGRGMSLRELAEIARLSPLHLSRAFKAATGRTVHRFVMDSRLLRAKELLAETTRPLKQVAAEAGFATQSHFTETFRRHVGVTPLSYRQHQDARDLHAWPPAT